MFFDFFARIGCRPDLRICYDLCELFKLLSPLLCARLKNRTNKSNYLKYMLSQWFTLDWVGSTVDLNDGAIEEVFTKHAGINSGRHKDNSDFRICLNYVSQYHHEEVSLYTEKQEC